MIPNVSIFRKTQQTTSNWSGGTTTQLYIFPQDAEYGKRNFRFRVSTATVEDETSTFTSLPGIARHLMILDGNLRITHEGEYTKQLQPMDVDSFDGGWHTTGIGKVTDFNLMTAKGCEGSLLSKTLLSGQSLSQTFAPGVDLMGCYLFDGSINMQLDSAGYNLQEKDFMMIPATTGTLQIQAAIDSRIVFCPISLYAS